MLLSAREQLTQFVIELKNSLILFQLLAAFLLHVPLVHGRSCNGCSTSDGYPSGYSGAGSYAGGFGYSGSGGQGSCSSSSQCPAFAPLCLSLGIASVLLIGKGDLGVDQGLVEDGVGGQGMMGSGEEVRQMSLFFFK